jgi:hypothetical protein
MSCKTLSIETLPITEYRISIIEEDWTETPVDYVEYNVSLLSILSHEVEMKITENEAEYKILPNFLVSDNQDSFSFLYCVSYRHPSLPERILARWFWNDQWIWTNDDLWNDF